MAAPKPAPAAGNEANARGRTAAAVEVAAAAHALHPRRAHSKWFARAATPNRHGPTLMELAKKMRRSGGMAQACRPGAAALDWTGGELRRRLASSAATTIETPQTKNGSVLQMDLTLQYDTRACNGGQMVRFPRLVECLDCQAQIRKGYLLKVYCNASECRDRALCKRCLLLNLEASSDSKQ